MAELVLVPVLVVLEAVLEVAEVVVVVVVVVLVLLLLLLLVVVVVDAALSFVVSEGCEPSLAVPAV